MQKITAVQVNAPAPTSQKKLPYQTPSLRMFGRVSSLTQAISMGANGDGGQGMMVSSDRSIKENIVQVGVHPSGIGLYLFDYKPEFRSSTGQGRRFGVMADEVETLMPEAVSLHPDGYQQVNYSMLNIALVPSQIH